MTAPPIEPVADVTGVDMRATLSVYRYGQRDPTTQLSDRELWRATYTPDGPATLHLWWNRHDVFAEAWGEGAAWMLSRVPALVGASDPGFDCPPGAHPAIIAAARDNPGLRLAASSTLYHELLPIILGQRVTGIEAISQWRRLCQRLSVAAPGPPRSMLLPPSPEALLGKPAWWYHPLGIEAKRAEAMRTVARHARRIIEQWSSLGPIDAAAKLHLLPGIGVWTIGSALGPALGDPDAVPVGDYHVKNNVSWALAREPRGTDERMLQLLQPYAGQRGRIVRLLSMDGNAAPKFGPRQRIQPMWRR